MIEKQIRTKILEATKARDQVTKDILKLVIGEVERLSCVEKTDDVWIKVIKKMIGGIDSTIEAAENTREDLVNQLKREKEILTIFLPIVMTKQEIKDFIINNVPIDIALGEGRIIGAVIKALKTSEAVFENTDVKNVVKELINEKV